MNGRPQGLGLGELFVAIGMIVLGLVAAWQTTQIPQSAYAAVGPRVFPWVAATMLIVMGVALAIAAFRGGWKDEAPEFGEVDWTGGLWLIGGLVANVALIDHLGFILASTVLFACTARGFGSTRIARDVAIGFALAFVAYVGFDRVLGYKIGIGLIERLI